MVRVYFESNAHSELVALFATEELYLACNDALEKFAADGRMIVTEGLDESSIDNLVELSL